ncbi:leucine--tRNA ligase [candidate division WOR-3 bacterium]|nr:leucine--tRNA ligase [candidate division WOR-3 bacterium]
MYPFRDIEKKWQKRWEEIGLYRTPEKPEDKYYIMEMWPYTSGDIHIGHFRNYSFGDLRWRWEKMMGKDILHPFGWDAFGLPAEEAAIKKNLDPREWTYNNIKAARRTIKKLGFSYDWEREVITSDPDYYKWTQWLLIQLYKEGLLYRKEAYVNWCPGCKTVLANEQVEGGLCWRCDSKVEKRKLEQWFVRTTDYVEGLLNDIETLDEWPENIKEMQRNWIGKNEGATIRFTMENGEEFEVFTTRPDTIYGVTFICLSPESEIAEVIAKKNKEVKQYIHDALLMSNIERTIVDREKTGVNTHYNAIHPLTNEEMPVFVADFVLGSYGTGIVMGVPAHDQRDFEFAKKFKLPIRQVIKPEKETEENTAFTGHGIMINSGEFDGMRSEEFIKKITQVLESKGVGCKSINYRLKDWLIARQRYWGAPIPMIHCEKCGIVPVPEEDLPVLLPPTKEVDFIPKSRSPLADHSNFMNTKCPKCGGAALRDPDTADTFVDSAWYHLRYLDAKNKAKIFDRGEADKWLPVDLYIGGAEHATGHLIYMRFITKFLHKLGYLSVKEPVLRLFNQGMVRDENGVVMSKSKGNAVDTEELVAKIGVDAAKIAILFFGPPDSDIDWREENIKGSTRFLTKIYDLFYENARKGAISLDINDKQKTLFKVVEKTTKKVTNDIEKFSYNTAIAALMELLNKITDYVDKNDNLFQYTIRRFMSLLAPFAPHITEEIYSRFGNKESIFLEDWPIYDKEAIIEEQFTLIIQINGKLRARAVADKGIDKEKALEIALKQENVQKFIKGNHKKVIYVPDKLINIVV